MPTAGVDDRAGGLVMDDNVIRCKADGHGLAIKTGGGFCVCASAAECVERSDRLADECHGYDLDGYPVGDLSDCPPAIAAKLDRCNKIAQAQRSKSQWLWERPHRPRPRHRLPICLFILSF